MTDTKASSLLNKILCTLYDLIQMQFHPCLNLKMEKSQGGQVALRHLAIRRRYCSLDGVLESCHGEGASAGYRVWTPRSCLGGGAGQGPRAKQDSELWGQRWSRWDIWEQSVCGQGEVCGASRDGGMFSESGCVETIPPFLKGHFALPGALPTPPVFVFLQMCTSLIPPLKSTLWRQVQTLLIFVPLSQPTPKA